jgi:hypothetical protein
MSLLHQPSRPPPVRDQVGSSDPNRLLSRGRVYDLPERQLPRRSIIDFVFLLYAIVYGLYFVSLIAFANLTSFQWQEGGALALTQFKVCISGGCNSLLARILFRGKLALFLFSCLVSYPSSSVSGLIYSYFGQLLDPLPQYNACRCLQYLRFSLCCVKSLCPYLVFYFQGSGRWCKASQCGQANIAYEENIVQKLKRN